MSQRLPIHEPSGAAVWRGLLMGGLEARSNLRIAAFSETGWIYLYIMLWFTFRLPGRLRVVDEPASWAALLLRARSMKGA